MNIYEGYTNKYEFCIFEPDNLFIKILNFIFYKNKYLHGNLTIKILYFD